MRLASPSAEFYIPDGATEDDALRRATHVAVGAHQDDLEIMAYHGILECFRSAENHFLGVTVADGAGSPRAGAYAETTDEEMQAIRRQEQKRAAAIGQYSGVIQLNRPSRDVKSGAARGIVDDLKAIFDLARPRIAYTHNLADKHDTHVGVAVKVVAALRELEPDARPERVYGCEVWRDLDWLQDADKIVLDVSARENLAAALLGTYDSQVAGGKRYDLAAMGRRRANASFFASHGTDESTGLSFAMDLTPLVHDPGIDPFEYVRRHIDRFSADVAERIRKVSAP